MKTPSWLRPVLAGALCSLAGLAAAVDTGPQVFPAYRNGAEIGARCDAMLADIGAQARRLAQGPLPPDGLLAGLDRLDQTAEDTIGPIAFLANVHPLASVREAAEACELRHQVFSNRLYQDAKLHARLRALAPADAIDALMHQERLAVFEDAGVALAPAARVRARRLSTEISALAQGFDRAVREQRRRVAFTEAELDGLPPDLWRAAPRDAQGRVRLALDAPIYAAVMEGAHDAAARERMWRAFQNVGGRANLQRLARIADKRRAYAALFGLASYAEFGVRRRMAQRVGRVQTFLDEVGTVATARAQVELADLRAAKAAHLHVPLEQAVLKHWDLAYYTQRIKRERYALDQSRFRRHFPPAASVDFVFALGGRLFDVGFRPLAQTLWHPDAKAYEVFDLGSGRALATLYLDLYPRADKYGHAAVWPLRGAATPAGRLPAAALVTNLDRDGLTLIELETLLHEFGHALHGTLSTTRYAALSGTAVKLDFVEAPSQMLEEWLYEPRVLAMLQEVCPRCEPVPADLVARAVRSRGFGKGLEFARQHLYASYDLALHGPRAVEPLALWQRMQGATPLGYVPGTMFPAGFDHVAGGYGAGYYAYLWSLATAQDLYTAFAADPFDAAAGRRYRDIVLANGGQVEPDELVRRFLGRAPDNAAFFAWLNR